MKCATPLGKLTIDEKCETLIEYDISIHFLNPFRIFTENSWQCLDISIPFLVVAL